MNGRPSHTRRVCQQNDRSGVRWDTHEIILATGEAMIQQSRDGITYNCVLVTALWRRKQDGCLGHLSLICIKSIKGILVWCNRLGARPGALVTLLSDMKIREEIFFM